jgi:hypothetical protein
VLGLCFFSLLRGRSAWEWIGIGGLGSRRHGHGGMTEGGAYLPRGYKEVLHELELDEGSNERG